MFVLIIKMFGTFRFSHIELELFVVSRYKLGNRLFNGGRNRVCSIVICSLQEALTVSVFRMDYYLVKLLLKVGLAYISFNKLPIRCFSQ